ncbi:MAG: ferredoxin [Bacteroidales bacterium]|nr:ferredoxin [Bacteroidales bacterium]
MSIKKIWIEPGCISCGECEEICPEVFVVTDECHVNPDADISKFTDRIKEAAEACPVEVIKYEE